MFVCLTFITYYFSKHPLHNQPSITNPQYFGQPGMHMTIGDHRDHDIYEEYATIDDTGVGLSDTIIPIMLNLHRVILKSKITKILNSEENSKRSP